MSAEHFFKTELGIDDPAITTRLASTAWVEDLKKGHRLLSMGERVEVLPFLMKGVLRGYVVDEKGRDITDCLISHRGDVITGSGELAAPSPINIETLTDCRVVMVPLADLLPLMEHPAMMSLYNQQLSDALTRHWELKMLLYQCSAMERYQWFLQRYPGLEDVVSGKHLSSFLCMTPVTLSRLRRRLRESS